MDEKETAEKTVVPFRNIFRQYEKQLLAARQLARFRARNLGVDPRDYEEPSPQRHRGNCVSKVAEELSLSLMISGNPFPVFESIRKDLSRQLNKEVEFVYPPGKKLRIFVRESNGLRPLNEQEQELADRELERITLHHVDEEMSYNPRRSKTV